jgi:serine/tyrosine/threonine adenylyltransferase
MSLAPRALCLSPPQLFHRGALLRPLLRGMASAAATGSHVAAEAPPFGVGGWGASDPRWLVLEKLPASYPTTRDLTPSRGRF